MTLDPDEPQDPENMPDGLIDEYEVEYDEDALDRYLRDLVDDETGD